MDLLARRESTRWSFAIPRASAQCVLNISPCRLMHIGLALLLCLIISSTRPIVYHEVLVAFTNQQQRNENMLHCLRHQKTLPLSHSPRTTLTQITNLDRTGDKLVSKH
jgi:hypothetical protein